jgi:hypothetical protein
MINDISNVYQVYAPTDDSQYDITNRWSETRMYSFNLRNLSIFKFLLSNFSSKFFYWVTITSFGCLKTIATLCEQFPLQIQYGGRPIYWTNAKLLYVGGTNVLLSRRTLEILIDEIPRHDLRIPTDILLGLACRHIPRFLMPVTDFRSDTNNSNELLLQMYCDHSNASKMGEFQFTCKNIGGPIPRLIYDSALLSTLMSRSLRRTANDIADSVDLVRRFGSGGYKSRVSFVHST